MFSDEGNRTTTRDAEGGSHVHYIRSLCHSLQVRGTIAGESRKVAYVVNNENIWFPNVLKINVIQVTFENTAHKKDSLSICSILSVWRVRSCYCYD
jgi:hypothetical protein